MSWFKSSIAQYAQDALVQAQASIDKALEIEPAQDPLSGGSSSGRSGPKPRKPRTPPTTRRTETTRAGAKPKTESTEKSEGDNWAAWGASTVNNIWESSFSSAPDSSETRSPSTRKKSNALKLGGQKRPSPTINKRPDQGLKNPPEKLIKNKNQQLSKEPTLVEVTIKDTTTVDDDGLQVTTKCSEAANEWCELPNTSDVSSSELTPTTIDITGSLKKVESSGSLHAVESNSKTDETFAFTKNVSNSGTLLKSTEALKTVEMPASLKGSDNSSMSKTLEVADKEPVTPTLSTCSSSSALSQITMVKSSSSNSSEQSTNASVCTLTVEAAQQVLQDTVVAEVSEESVSPEREGWSDDEIDVDKASSDQDSRSSFEMTEHKRCLSIGSTASSSILMLQSPYDTTESSTGDKSDKSDEKSEKSDEDSLKTPTNLPLPPTPKLELAQQTISEETQISTVPSRIITSPTHSEQSDLIVISEDTPSPSASNNEMMKLKEILHAREQRLFKMNQEYVEVQDELQNERQRSHNLEQNLNLLSQKHTFAVEKFEEELGAMEDLKNHIEGELQSLKDLGDISELRRDLEEKDQLIEELTMEGEKLAQASFNSSNNVKKLRQKEKEDEKMIKEQNGKIESLYKEIEQLKLNIKEQQRAVQENEENISELNSIIRTQSEELSTARCTLESCEGENVAFKAKVESYQLEIQTLRDLNSQAESRANQESLSANIKAKEQAQAAVEDLQASTDATIKQLNSQISEQQEVIARLEQQGVWRDQRHRDQIQELHCRVEDADGRNQDISTSITASTQPLLRQIQLFKESLANQQANWEKIEGELKDKLDVARSDLSTSEMEKRELHDRLQLAKNKISTSQTLLDTLRSERNELEVSVEVTQNKLNLLEEGRRKDANKSDSIKAQFVQSLEDSRTENEELRKELVHMQSYVRELESSKSVMSEVEDIASRSSTPPVEFTSQTNILERSLFGSSTPNSLSQSMPSYSHSSYEMEKLTSQLKQTQSEILSYQEQIRSLSLSKASLSAEITSVSQKCAEFEQQCTDLPKIRKENKELQTRYDTLLQMYGEKAEEVHELQLDLADVREAYKAQIEQLLSKVIR